MPYLSRIFVLFIYFVLNGRNTYAPTCSKMSRTHVKFDSPELSFGGDKQIVFGLICIIMCMSYGLDQGMQSCGKGNHAILDKKKKDLSEKELHLITRILSIGLVDADPDTLQHIKEYRDLRGSSN